MRLKNEQGSGMKKKESFVLRSSKCPTWYFGNIGKCNGFFNVEGFQNGSVHELYNLKALKT